VKKVVAAALLIIPSVLFVIGCSRPPEQQFLSQFFRAARPVQEIGVVLRVDHAHGTERPAGDDRTGAQDRRVEAVAVTDDKPDIGALRRGDHAVALVERDRHRFFHQHMLAGGGSRFDVVGVQLVRRGNVDNIDFRVGAHRLDRPIDAAAEFPGEAHGCVGARIGGGDQLDPRVRRQRRQHQREGASQPRDAYPQSALRHREPPGAGRHRPIGLPSCSTSRLGLPIIYLGP